MRFLTLFLIIVSFSGNISAHPAPNSLIQIDMHPKGISMELQLPLIELQAAMGLNWGENPENLVALYRDSIQKYLEKHIQLISEDGLKWTINFGIMRVLDEQKNFIIGVSRNLEVQLWCEAPTNANHRKFTLKYDAIIHQVITHNALVSIRQDWETGINSDKPVQVGIICLDIPRNIIPSLDINQTEGSPWLGFKSMIALGMKHISEGFDHLLFLFVLLLVSPLQVESKHWNKFGGVRYSFMRLIQIVTAFTIGHSLTLLLGTIGWMRFPSQYIEILIAFSILVSSVHALRPIFFGKEIYIALGFGLIHGLAFATTLSNLNLTPQYLAISIFGFNLGIELQQLFVIVLIMPSLIVLSRFRIYKFIQISGASAAFVVSLSWIIERITNHPNRISQFALKIAPHLGWLVALLSILALGVYLISTKNKRI